MDSYDKSYLDIVVLGYPHILLVLINAFFIDFMRFSYYNFNWCFLIKRRWIYYEDDISTKKETEIQSTWI